MIDIKFIRQNPDKIKECCKGKQVNIDVDLILELDRKKREYLQKIEDLKFKKNKLSKTKIEEAKEIKKEIKELEPELETIDKKLEELLLRIPNLSLECVPYGKDESDNVVLREVGKKPNFNFEPKSYLEIAEKLNLIDVKRGAKVAGTRFGYITREAALLEFALVNFAFETLEKEEFVPVIPPVMLKPEMARGMGYLEQTDEQEAYYLPKDNLYLVGTSEQSIGTMHSNETFQEKELPKRYVAFSTCFRREAKAYDEDTKGILRVHQFDKIEMFSFVHPKNSEKEHQFLLELEEGLMKALKIPYRVIQVCTGDLERPATNKYDIETWMPGQGRYIETHSTSNCTDFQARSLHIRYRDTKTKKPEFVHTLNGTVFAIGRILVAIIENYQQKDGNVKIPEILRKYTLGTPRVISK